MRFYLKLTAFVLVFLVLSSLSGEAGGIHLYEAGFALRCQVAALRHDATMQQALAREYQEHLRMMMARNVLAAAAVAVASPGGATTRPTTRASVDW